MVMKNEEIISEKMIKPSSPTPHHLRNLKLSFLDQISTPIYIPLIFFYNHHSNQIIDQSERSSLLKTSLADTLTRYYPLAGSLKEGSSWIDCNDVGVQYIESKVSCKLSELIRNPNTKEMNSFLPFEPYFNENGQSREVLLAVKANFFECGDLAIGVCVSHMIADGTSAITFLNDWATTCLCGAIDEATACPIFDAASYFPPKDLVGFKRNISKDTIEENIVTKRFVFEKSKIIALKEVATGSKVKNPTRVEAVSALIWQRIMAIARSKSTQQTKSFAAIHVVNLRPRMVPPLPTHSFANLWWRAVIAPSTVVDADHKDNYPALVCQISNAIKQVNSNYIKMLQSGDGQMRVIQNLSGKFTSGEIEFCSFTSWCRFPMYEVDFGWGKPTWVFSPIQAFKNLVVLTSTKDGDGIEAWVNLVDEDMTLFERDAEILSFVSSPANIGE